MEDTIPSVYTSILCLFRNENNDPLELKRGGQKNMIFIKTNSKAKQDKFKMVKSIS